VESGALVFTFGGNADINDDAWAEQNMKLAPRQRLFVGMDVETDDAYFHRYPSASSNNKVLNVFGGAEGATRDEAYQQKQVGFGLHHWGYPTSHVNHGKSNLQVSMAAQGLSAGPYGTGPYTLTLNPGVNRRRLAIFMQVGTFIAPGKPAGCTAPNHGDAIMQVWLDGQMIYDHRDLPIFTPGGYNHIQYLYLLGWSNSGFTQTTAMRIRELVIASEPLTDWTT
jgi:hypothetical protein